MILTGRAGFLPPIGSSDLVSCRVIPSDPEGRYDGIRPIRAELPDYFGQPQLSDIIALSWIYRPGIGTLYKGDRFRRNTPDGKTLSLCWCTRGDPKKRRQCIRNSKSSEGIFAEHLSREYRIAGERAGRLLPRLLVAAPGVVGDGPLPDRLTIWSTLYAGFEQQPEILRGDSLPPSPESLFGWRPFQHEPPSVRMIRHVVRRAPHFDILVVHFDSGTNFWRDAVPLILAGRFFGKKIVLDYQHMRDISPLYESSPLFHKFLRLCHSVLVLSDYQVQTSSRFGLATVHLPTGIVRENVSGRRISDVQPRLLVSAPLEQVSNLPGAIAAFKLVKQKYPRTELVIAGTGTRERTLRSMVARERLSGVEFLTPRDGDAYARRFETADVFLNCSAVDYLSTDMLMALASGMPVISTPVGSIVNSFIEHQDILFVPYNNRGSLADRIIELVEHPELVERLSANASSKASRFNWHDVRSSWLTFLRTLA